MACDSGGAGRTHEGYPTGYSPHRAEAGPCGVADTVHHKGSAGNRVGEPLGPLLPVYPGEGYPTGYSPHRAEAGPCGGVDTAGRMGSPGSAGSGTVAAGTVRSSAGLGPPQPWSSPPPRAQPAAHNTA